MCVAGRRQAVPRGARDLPASADRAFAAKRLLNDNPRRASRDQILTLLEANFEN